MDAKTMKTATIISTILISGFILTIAPLAHAAAVDSALGKLNTIGGITGFGETRGGDVGLYEKIAAVINILLGFAGVVAVIFIIYAGFRWITASGNEEQVKEARGNIRNAVIGLVVIFLAFVITNFVTKSLIDVIGG